MIRFKTTKLAVISFLIFKLKQNKASDLF
jgi:hypothetical protein